MWERRAAIILCVLLSHAFILYSLMRLTTNPERLPVDEFVSEPITLLLEPIEERNTSAPPAIASRAPVSAPTTKSVAPVVPPAGESVAITPPARVDWPIEAKKSATRVLAAEA
jgi:hypothetical protein